MADPLAMHTPHLDIHPQRPSSVKYKHTCQRFGDVVGRSCNVISNALGHCHTVVQTSNQLSRWLLTLATTIIVVAERPTAIPKLFLDHFPLHTRCAAIHKKSVLNPS